MTFQAAFGFSEPKDHEELIAALPRVREVLENARTARDLAIARMSSFATYQEMLRLSWHLMQLEGAVSDTPGLATGLEFFRPTFVGTC